MDDLYDIPKHEQSHGRSEANKESINVQDTDDHIKI